MVFDPEKLNAIRGGQVGSKQLYKVATILLNRYFQGADFKESFDMGNEADRNVENVWLPDEELPGFRKYAVDFWKTCQRFETDLLGALSLGIPGIAKDFLMDYHQEGRNQLR